MDVQSLINTLSLEEKCALLSGAETFKSRGMPQHGIPQMWLSDGPHGVRKQAGESDHLGLNPSVPATCFPTASAVANSWDVALGEEIGQALGVKHGSTLEMPAPGGDSVRELMAAVQSGKITESDVNTRLKELLPLIFDTRAALDKAPKQFDEAAHHELARRASAESLVLLKNEDSLLPLSEGIKVAVIGDFAETPRYQGAGSSMVNSTKVDTLLDTLKATGLNITGYAQGFDRHGKPDESLRQGACELAANAQVALVCLGLDEIQESEGLDRSAMKLAQNQIDLLAAVSKVNPNVVVVLHCGSVVETPWLSDCKALLYAALGGQAGAGAVADALVGKGNPSGKLAESWPVRYEDVPSAAHFACKGKTVEYREGPYIGYRYFETAGVPVQFPFGYGLSYTQFTYSDLSADEHGVSFTVANAGTVAGSEVAQIYISKTDSAIFRPIKELKGFARVTLAPGEKQRMSMGMVDGLVMELKGFWFIGLIRVIYEFIKNQIQNAAMEKRLKGGA